MLNIKWLLVFSILWLSGCNALGSPELGPDGKPIPGPEQMRQIQAARKMGQQQAQVEEVIGIMHKNVENV